MDYFEKLFIRILENFKFSLKIYGNSYQKRQCYEGCLKELDSIVCKHDYNDYFSARLRELAEKYKKKVKICYSR